MRRHLPGGETKMFIFEQRRKVSICVVGHQTFVIKKIHIKDFIFFIIIRFVYLKKLFYLSKEISSKISASAEEKSGS